MNFINHQTENNNIDDYLGRPAHYPNIENYENLLFYIQRNQNINAVIYEANMLPGNILNLHDPIKIHWLKYDKNSNTEKQTLNYIQKKLAYGCKFNVISNDMIEFRFVSYDQMNFFLAKDKKNFFKVFTKMGDGYIELNSIFIYAEDYGVFPQVKFAEFFGKNVNSGEKYYKKLNLEY